MTWRRLRAQWRTARSRSTVAARAPVLVVCPRNHDFRVWEALLRHSASRQRPDELPVVALAVASDVLGSHAYNDRVWFDASRGQWRALLDHVLWSAADDDDATQDDEDDGEPPPHAQPGWVGGSAAATASRHAIEHPPAQASGRRRTAALALRLSAAELRMATWLATTPWLAADDFARLEGASPQLVRRRLRVPRDAGVAFVVPSSDGPRWGLGRPGRDLVAARAGFPRDRGRFAQEASLQAAFDIVRQDARNDESCGVWRASSRAASLGADRLHAEEVLLRPAGENDQYGAHLHQPAGSPRGPAKVGRVSLTIDVGQLFSCPAAESGVSGFQPHARCQVQGASTHPRGPHTGHGIRCSATPR